MILKRLARAVLILLPLAMIGARLHARLTQAPITVEQDPVSVTQDVNRCLLIVRSAASRRGQARVGTNDVHTARADPPMQQASSAPPAAA